MILVLPECFLPPDTLGYGQFTIAFSHVIFVSFIVQTSRNEHSTGSLLPERKWGIRGKNRIMSNVHLEKYEALGGEVVSLEIGMFLILLVATLITLFISILANRRRDNFPDTSH